MTIIMHLNLLKLARKPNDQKKKKKWPKEKGEKRGNNNLLYYTLRLK